MPTHRFPSVLNQNTPDHRNPWLEAIHAVGRLCAAEGITNPFTAGVRFEPGNGDDVLEREIYEDAFTVTHKADGTVCITAHGDFYSQLLDDAVGALHRKENGCGVDMILSG